MRKEKMMKKGLILFVGIITAVFVLIGCASSEKEKDSPMLYKNEDARKISHASYDKAMELWDVPWTEEWVHSEFGRTHVVLSGPEDGKPLVLLPGLFSDASMWYAQAGDLSKKYRVITVDLPVYGGKSEPSEQKIEDVDDYSRWFTSLVSHFGYNRVAVAGLSYSSWLCLALAREIPDSISAMVMMDPSQTFAKMRGSMMWKGFRYFAFFPNREKYGKFFDWMGGGYSDPRLDVWFEHMLDVIEYGSVGMMDVPQHRVYSPGELTMVTMPVLVLAGGKPIIYKDPEDFAEKARAALPHVEVEIVPGTGHSLNMEKAKVVNTRIMRFLDENYS